MTRSVLVYFPGFPFTSVTLFPDKGLAEVAGALLAENHETMVVDYGDLSVLERIYEDEKGEFLSDLDVLADPGIEGFIEKASTLWKFWRIKKRISARVHELSWDAARQALRGRVDFVLMSLRVAQDVGAAIGLASILRALYPDIRIAAAGPVAEEHGAELIAFTGVFDCVFIGNLGVAAVAWARALHNPEQWRDIPGILAQSGSKAESQSRVPAMSPEAVFPCYHPSIYPAARSRHKLRLFTLDEQYSGIGGGKRIKPPGRLCDEISALQKQFGASAFYLRGEGSAAPYPAAFAREARGRGLDVAYARAAHAGYTDLACLEAMRDSGCLSIGFQINSGSQRLLDDYYGEGLEITPVEKVLGASRQLGLYTVAKFSYPCPMDDYHTRAETLRLIQRTRPHAAPVNIAGAPGRVAWGWRTTGFDARAYCWGLTRGVWRDSSNVSFGPAQPYAMGRLSPAQAERCRDMLRREISELGVSVDADEGVALIAQLAGYAGRENEFAQFLSYRLLEGNIEVLAPLLEQYNACVTARGNVAPFRRGSSMRDAVGN